MFAGFLPISETDDVWRWLRASDQVRAAADGALAF